MERKRGASQSTWSELVGRWVVTPAGQAPPCPTWGLEADSAVAGGPGDPSEPPRVAGGPQGGRSPQPRKNLKQRNLSETQLL